jgi:hypothetical protein
MQRGRRDARALPALLTMRLKESKSLCGEAGRLSCAGLSRAPLVRQLHFIVLCRFPGPTPSSASKSSSTIRKGYWSAFSMTRTHSRLPRPFPLARSSAEAARVPGERGGRVRSATPDAPETVPQRGCVPAKNVIQNCPSWGASFITVPGCGFRIASPRCVVRIAFMSGIKK